MTAGGASAGRHDDEALPNRTWIVCVSPWRSRISGVGAVLCHIGHGWAPVGPSRRALSRCDNVRCWPVRVAFARSPRRRQIERHPHLAWNCRRTLRCGPAGEVDILRVGAGARGSNRTMIGDSSLTRATFTAPHPTPQRASRLPSIEIKSLAPTHLPSACGPCVCTSRLAAWFASPTVVPHTLPNS